MQNKQWLKTFRSLGLLMLCAASIGLLHASDTSDAVDNAGLPLVSTGNEPVYLYYFESSEATLDNDTPDALFSFGTLPKEKVTLVAYGLDDIIEPELTLTDIDGTFIAEGRPTGNPHVALYQFEAEENRRYNFKISRKNRDADLKGLVRVMVFEGDPIADDTTYLDNVNPLLPGRSFMVAGKPQGLRMAVEALPISRFNDDKPDLFASRGSDEEMPPEAERTVAKPEFDWNNLDIPGVDFYTVTIRATPETLNETTKLKYKQLNANSFFYYNFYLIIGAGGAIRSVPRGDACQTDPNRIECIREDGISSGRTAPAPKLEVPVEVPKEDAIIPLEETSDDDGPPQPAGTVLSTCGALNEPGHTSDFPETPESYIYFAYIDSDGVFHFIWFVPDGDKIDDPGVSNPKLQGTNCNDRIFGEDGDDSIDGGIGYDYIEGGTEDDIIFGGSENDIILGGAGDDQIYGEEDNDRLFGEDGEDEIFGGAGNDQILPGDDLDDVHGNEGDDIIFVELDGAANIYNGDADTDTIIYQTANPITLLLQVGQETATGIGGPSSTNATDLIRNIEHITLGRGDDTANILDLTGILSVNAGGGADTANFNMAGPAVISVNGSANQSATAGAVTVALENFEVFNGTGAADTFNITSDNDSNTLNGRGGTDAANLTSAVGLIVNATNASTQTITVQDAAGGFTSTDTYLGIENLTLSNQSDTLTIHDSGTALDTVTNIYTGGSGTDTATYDLTSGTPQDLTVTVTAGNIGVQDTANLAAWKDTFIGFESVISGAGDDTWKMTTGVTSNATFNAGAGTDTADYSTVPVGTDLTVNITTTNTTVQTGSFTQTLINFESVIAGGGDDSWTVNTGTGTTDRTFNGGSGTDSVSYNDTSGNPALAYTANLTAASSTIVDNDPATPDTDTLISIENLTTDDLGDVITIQGSSVATLNTLGGADIINAGGTGGLDAVANTYNMGLGVDLLSYSANNVAITVNYTAAGSGTVTEGAKAVDSFTSVEQITGGTGGDTFNVAVNGINNTFIGGNGTDTITYTGGPIIVTFGAVDTVTGGGGIDTISEFETINGSTSVDQLDFSTVAAPLTVTQTGCTTGSVSGAETMAFSNFDIFTGGTDDDIFNVTWGDCNLTFDGGGTTDVDEINYTAAAGAPTGLTFTLGATSTVTNGGANTHTLTSFAIVRGTDLADTFNISTSTYTMVDGDDGDDTFTVDDAAFTGDFTIDGGAGTNDAYVYNNTDPLTISLAASLTNASNTVTATVSDGGGPPALTTQTHTLTNVEDVTLNTQAGTANTVVINDTDEVTSVTTGAGNETITVTDGGTVTDLNTGSGIDVVNVTNADDMTVINTGAGNDTVNLLAQDGTSTTANGGPGVDTFSVTTTAATTVNQSATGFTVAAGGQTDAFESFDIGTFNSGNGADIFTIDTDIAGNWVINSGTGANQYKFTGSGLGNVTVTVNSGNGNLDTLDFSGMATGVTVDAGNTTAAGQTVVGSFKLILQDAIAKVEGSAQTDTITGTAGGDTINGNGGADTIYGLEGDDILGGGDGIDTIYGGLGSDTVNGGNDADLLFGGSDVTAACTAAGNDAGDDIVNGDAGADVVYGGHDNTGLAVGDAGCQDTGNDTVNGGADGDTVYGGNRNGNGVVGGNDGNDLSVNGGTGNDTVYGGNNNCADLAGGGHGTDGNDGTLPGATTSVSGGNGDDTIYGGNNNACAGATGNTDGNDVIHDVQATNGKDTVYGGNNNVGSGAAAGNNDGVDGITTNDPGSTAANSDTIHTGNNNGDPAAGIGTDGGNGIVDRDNGGTDPDILVNGNDTTP